MKTFMRSIFIGVCVLSSYGLVEASDQVSDTITAEGCYKPGAQIKSGIVKSAFSAMRHSDSVGIVEKSTNYKVEYNNFRLEFTKDGIKDKKTCTDFDSEIGVATDNLRDQFINCTITYTRIISFNDVDLTDYDSEHAIPEDDLLGDKKEKDGYPKFELKSERKWHMVIRIKKALSSNAEFTIEGSHCLVNGQTTLNVPDRFRDMTFQWTSIESNDRFVTPTAYKTTVIRQNNKILETTVTCTISDGCTNFKNTASLKLVPDQTPASTLEFSDCLPTDATYIDVVAKNPISGVGFSWVGTTPEIASSTPSSITVRYHVPSIHNFRINLETTGGCNSTPTSKVVQRKLGNNVKLHILDSCLASKQPFRVVTEPALIGWSLKWMLGQPDYTVALINNNRADMVTITRNKAEGGLYSIQVMDAFCHGTVSRSGFISEAYTEMKAEVTSGKLIGRLLKERDSVLPESQITFTAPQHSSISGYTWSTWYSDGRPSSLWQGGKELTITSPKVGYTMSVSVSYKSCLGQQRKTYSLKSSNEFYFLFETNTEK